ncbi:MAG: hypothetical protein NTX24_00135 [Candidatus Pacearchaeota archaeon]|nr:hypothetical protein [Candidatus Pacearchaeota archaeon]
MNNKTKMLGIISLVLVIMLIFLLSDTFAGEPTVNTVSRTPDKTSVNIGDEISLTYSITTTNNLRCLVIETKDGDRKSMLDSGCEVTAGSEYPNQIVFNDNSQKRIVKIKVNNTNGCNIKGKYKCGDDAAKDLDLIKINVVTEKAILDAEQCNEKNGGKGTMCRDKTKEGTATCTSEEILNEKLKCTNPAQVCCVSANCTTNAGYDLFDSKDESSKCMENSLINAPDAKEGKICCKIKEKIRESVKEPGTLGRLNSCFGKYTWGKYTWWGQDGENAMLSGAAKEIEGSKSALTGAKCEGVVSHFTSTIYNSSATDKNKLDSLTLTQRSDAIETINKELSDCRTALAPVAGATVSDTNKAAMKSLKKAQDSLEKARGITAMTWTERGATFISCEIGMTYASKLAFGNYWAGPLFGTGGGMLASLGEGSGIFGPGKILSQDARAILGNAAGGFLASFTSPDSLENEMGSCNPEQTIKGSQLCSTCNEDPYRLCTRERCNILGNCIPVPTAKGDQVVCIAGKCEDIGMPIFTKGNIEWYVDTDLNGSQALTMQGGNIRTKINDGKSIPFNTKTIMVNVTTDKPAKCRYILDKTNASFTEMTDFEENEFPALTGGIAGPQAVHIMLSGIITRGVDHSIFIKCQNSCGIEPDTSYDQNIITFRLEQKPDELPPNIIYVDPVSGSMIRSDLQTIDASFWLDEKGDCRFADASNNYSSFNYSKMIPFGTYNNPNSSVISGSCDNTKKCLDRNDTCARCTLKLDLSKGYELTNYTSTEFNTTKTYHLIIKCNDQKSNVMTADDALDYILMTAPGYNITITEPPEDNMFTYDVQPEIQITSDPRQTQCKYKIYNLTSTQPNPAWDEMTFLDGDLGLVHTARINETLNAAPSPGHGYTIAALCRDKFNMEARAWRHLFIVEDINSPVLIRTYHDSITGDFLVLETDEPSLCVYSFDSCNFNFSQGILMTGNEEIHGTYWKDKTYFIKCVDAWGNYPSATGGTKNPAYNYCTATLKPFEIPKILL